MLFLFLYSFIGVLYLLWMVIRLIVGMKFTGKHILGLVIFLPQTLMFLLAGTAIVKIEKYKRGIK